MVINRSPNTKARQYKRDRRLQVYAASATERQEIISAAAAKKLSVSTYLLSFHRRGKREDAKRVASAKSQVPEPNLSTRLPERSQVGKRSLHGL
jgi:hypothetical protein